MVQGDKTGDVPLSELAKKYLKEKYNKPGDVFMGVVHRLDRPVSGALIFARTSKALARYNDLIKNREIKKIYWAIVKEMPPKEQDNLQHFLIRNSAMNKSFVTQKSNPKAIEAKLSYTLMASSKDYHLLEIELHTGRHHQIRLNCQPLDAR